MVANLASWLSDAWTDYQNGWAAADRELYDLCVRRGHDSFIDVYTKVAFINRVYAAGISRSIPTAAGADGETRVAQALVDSRVHVGASLTRLSGLDGINPDALMTIVEEHAKLVDQLALHCGGVRPTSFASKYLHFHCDLVPIFDSRVVEAIGKVMAPHIPRYQPTQQLLPRPPQYEPNYYWYVGRFLRLWELAGEVTPTPTVKMLDHALWQRG
ncbi:MAG: hypothetical protein KKA32_09940 [Actinobacteria bacterium]|nr:hypothetical protein [Actinomycetota bacterium]